MAKPNILDRAVATVAPVHAAKRAAARAALSVLNSGYGNYGANQTKKSMRGWMFHGGSAKEDIEDNLDVLRQRSRDAYMGIPTAAAALKTMRTNVVASGLIPSPQIDGAYLGLTEEQTEAVQEQITREFALWADTPVCDAERVDNFYQLQQLAFLLLNIGQVVIPAVLAAISVFAQGISDAIAGVKTIFEGIITFITGVFTGNWEQAWLGVRNIFTGIFDTLGALFKTPINAVIALINKAISGINGLGLDIPDWVPLIGGKKFSINIPEIPMLAKGGFTNGVSIAGEAGTEAVISFQRAVRQDNLRTWAMAGRMLGVRPVELEDIPERRESGDGGGSFTFAPQVIIQGNADRSVIDEALAEAKAQFEAWYLQMQRKQVRTAY